jgi:competence protein ComEA
MNQGIKTFLEWFGYSRRERRSSFILLIILSVIIAFRYLVPLRESEIEDLSGLLPLSASGQTLDSQTRRVATGSFFFDPNSASFDSLTLAGLSEKQARTIVNYRKKGGVFRDTADIRKIYGIDDSTASIIVPRIIITRGAGKVLPETIVRQSFKKPGDRLNLNRCDSAALVKLPGVGPVLSARIIKFRNLLGGFVTADQLKEVYGLKETTYDNIAGRVFADSSDISGIKINDAGYKELSRHPYLNRYEIESIIKYKELKGRFLNASELVENNIMTPERVKKISPYLRF